MAASGIRAGRAFVELFTDDSKLTKGLRSASARLRKWGASATRIGAGLTAAGAAIAGPIAAATKSFASAGDALDKMAKRTGMAVESLSALSHAAELGGTDVAALENGLRRMQRSAKEAADGTASYREAFDQLGVSVTDASGNLRSSEAIFMDLADALAGIENETQRAALAQEVFGRSGTALLPMLADGREGLQAAADEAKRLGLIMSTEDAAGAAKLTDAMARANASLKRVWETIGSALAPVITDLANSIADNAKGVMQWIRENKALIATIAKLGAGIAAMGASLVAIGASFNLAASGITGLAAAAKGLSVALAFLAANPLVAVGAAVGAATIGLIALADAHNAAALAANSHADALENVVRGQKGLNAEIEAGVSTAAELLPGAESNLAATKAKQKKVSARVKYLRDNEFSLGGAGLRELEQKEKELKVLSEARQAQEAQVASLRAQAAEEAKAKTKAETASQPSWRERAEAFLRDIAPWQSDPFGGADEAGQARRTAGTRAEQAAEEANRGFREAIEEFTRGLNRWEDDPFGGADKPQLPDLKDVERQLSTQGSFSAFAARGLSVGGGGVEQRQLKKLEGIHEGIEVIKRKAQHGGIVFA